MPIRIKIHSTLISIIFKIPTCDKSFDTIIISWDQIYLVVLVHDKVIGL
jgi:hypothetical protein